MRRIFSKIGGGIETVLPMPFSSFLIFLLIIYFIFIVAKTTSDNYKSNQSILAEQAKVASLSETVREMQNQINYFKTASFREKEAREKLGYRAPGEKAMSLPLDQPEDKVLPDAPGEVKIKTPNYRLWWKYYFE